MVQVAQLGYASAVSSKALSVSTKVEPEARAGSDFVGLPLVQANELLALALPLHLRLLEKRLLGRSISPRKCRFLEYG